MKKEKKLIAPNELSFGRWLAVLAATLGFYLVVFIVAVIVFPDLPKYLGAPGLIIHWLNNFIIFTMFTYQSAAITSSTIFIDTTPSSGALTLLSVFITHLPLVVYIIVDSIRRKKLAAKIEG